MFVCYARGGERGLHKKTLVELKDPSKFDPQKLTCWWEKRSL